MSQSFFRNQLQKSDRKFYPSVQGFRGVSALSVLVLHLYRMAQNGNFFPRVPAAVEAGWSTLGQGVALFFIISGFVIPASLMRHNDTGKFFLDRILRIMPLFLVIHFTVFFIGPFIGYKWLRDVSSLYYIELFFTNMTFTALLLGLPLAQQNSWTLTYEFLFYITTALVWNALSLRHGKNLLLTLLGLVIAGMWIMFPAFIFFAVGILFALVQPKIRIPPVVEVMIIPVAAVTFYYLAQFVSVTLAAIPGTILFMAVYQENSLTSRLMNTHVLQYTGKISYSLYLCHPIVLFPFQMAGRLLAQHHYGSVPVFIGFVLLGIPATFAVSILSFDLIENKLRVVLMNWLHVRRSPSVEQPAV